MAFRKLDMKAVKESLDYRSEKGHDSFVAEMKRLQLAVFMACGGGFLGRMAAEQPGDFYIDMRCSKLPYKARQIEQAVQVLCLYAEMAGFRTKGDTDLPKDYADFHAAGLL